MMKIKSLNVIHLRDVSPEKPYSLLTVAGTRVQLLGRVSLCATPWTVARQAPLSLGILQAGILATSSSRGSSRPRD